MFKYRRGTESNLQKIQEEIKMNKKLLIAALCLMLAGCATNETNEPTSAPAPAPSNGANAATPPASETGNEPTNGQTNETSETSTPVPTTPSVLSTTQLSPAFSFANEEGTKLMSVPTDTPYQVEELKKLNTAIGAGGQALSVRYEAEQQGDDQDNGRQFAYNFEHMAGHVFEVIEGGAVSNESYYLVNDVEFDTTSLLELKPVTEIKAIDDAKLLEAIAASHSGRAVQQGWQIAEISDPAAAGDAAARKPLYVVQFERQGDSMLASLLMKEGDQLIAIDYPAEYDDSSTWRVDDGGEISPDQFSFLFAARSEGGVLLGLKWLGAEGENISFLNQSGQQFIALPDFSAGRYMSPV